MKTYCLLFFLATFVSAHAEVRNIVIELTRVHSDRTDLEPTLATIYSDKENERKKEVPIAEAAEILKRATGYRSIVLVAVYAPRVRVKPEDLLALLTVVPHNPWLTLGPIVVGGEAAEIEAWKKSLTSRNEKAGV